MPDYVPIIPDSIEPRRGYKALNVMDDGTLCSPSYAAVWPPGRAYEAMCGATGEWGWTPVQGEPRSMDDRISFEAHRLQGGGMVTVSTALAASSASVRVPTQRPKPTNPLPPGWSWSWEMYTHDSPEPGCHCGVYIADEPKDCVTYMGKDNGIICEIALWGRVIPASSGARGQYAYPQRILAPRSLVGSVKDTARLYGIPTLVLDPLESRQICMEPQCECLVLCRVTGESLVGG